MLRGQNRGSRNSTCIFMCITHVHLLVILITIYYLEMKILDENLDDYENKCIIHNNIEK